MFKRFISIAVSLMIVLSVFSGCGSNNVQQVKSTVQQSTEEKNEQNLEVFTIKISSNLLGDEPTGYVKKYREDFGKVYKQKYPNANIEIVEIPTESFNELTKAQLASGSAADVILGSRALLPLAGTGYFLDLSNEAFVANMEGGIKDQVSYNGKVYFCPTSVLGTGLWYNRKMFTENGLTPAKTWSELMSLCQKLKAKGITPFAGGFKDAWVASYTVGALAPTYYGSLDFEKQLYEGTKKINGPEFQAVFSKIQEIQDHEYFGKDALSNGWDLSRKAFEDGKAGMIIQVSVIPGFCNTEMKDKGGFDAGFAPIPDENGKYVGNISVDVMYAINGKTKNPTRAIDLLAAMHDKTALFNRMADTGGFPALNGIEITYKEEGNKEFLKSFKDYKAIAQGVYLPASVATVFGNIVTKIVAGKKFDSTWLDEAQKAYDADKSSLSIH